MKIDMLFFQGCPNHLPTLALVQEVARDMGINVTVREVEVIAQADASRLRFLGSPTVQVEGRDLEPDRWDDQQFSLSCRMYGNSGVPSRELIASALARRNW